MGLKPPPGRILIVGPGHTFEQLAEVINQAFARWDLAHLHGFELADGRMIGIPDPDSISAPLIEPFVTELLLAHARELAYTSSERTSAIEQAQGKLEEAESELALYQETVRLSDVGAEHFEVGMRSRVAAVEEARRALATQRTGFAACLTRNAGRSLAEAERGRAPSRPAQLLICPETPAQARRQLVSVSHDCPAASQPAVRVRRGAVPRSPARGRPALRMNL